MAKLAIKKGAVDQSLYIFVEDSSKTTGVGLAGLTYNTSGLSASYVRPRGARVAITLANVTVTGAHVDGGFVAVDGTNMPGLYRFDVPDAVFATGVSSAVVMLQGAADMTPVLIEAQLTGFDLDVAEVTLADNAITANKIAANAIGATQIASNAIAAAKIATGAITADKLASNTITDAKIATDALSAVKFKADAVTKIQNGLATTANVQAVEGKVDAIPTTPLLAANYVAPDNVGIAAIKNKTDNLPASPAAVGSAMTLTSAYDAAKNAATQTSVNAIPTTPLLAANYVAPNNSGITDLLSRLSAARAGYLDKLNVAGTLANTNNASSFMANVNAVKLDPTQGAVTWGQQRFIVNVEGQGAIDIFNGHRDGIGVNIGGMDIGLRASGGNIDVTGFDPDMFKSIKGAGWTDETLKAIMEAVEAIGGGSGGDTAEQIWAYANRTLTASPTDISTLAKTTDLTPLAKTTDLANVAKKTDIPTDYAKKTDVPTVAQNQNGLAKTTDLSGLAKTTDLSGLATEANATANKNEIKTAIADKPVTPATNIDNLPTKTDIETAKDAIINAMPELDLSTIPDDLLSKIIVGELTVEQVLKVLAAIELGTTIGGGTSTITYTGGDGTKVTLSGVDESGNRGVVNVEFED